MAPILNKRYISIAGMTVNNRTRMGNITFLLSLFITKINAFPYLSIVKLLSTTKAYKNQWFRNDYE